MPILKSILFVDDDEDILFCYRLTLETENVAVYTANNADKALKIVKENKIDLAVLDYMLPDIRGDELAKRIHVIDPMVKIFFISGYNIALDAVKKLDFSVYGTFMKPIDLTVLQKIAATDDCASNSYQTMSRGFGNLYSNITTIGQYNQLQTPENYSYL